MASPLLLAVRKVTHVARFSTADGGDPAAARTGRPDCDRSCRRIRTGSPGAAPGPACDLPEPGAAPHRGCSRPHRGHPGRRSPIRLTPRTGAPYASGAPAATATGTQVSEVASDEQHDAARPGDRPALRRGWLREDCAHFQVADRRENRPHAATTDRGPRAHGSLFVPRLHRGTHDEPRATRPAPGRYCGSLHVREVHHRHQPRGNHPCRARCSRNRR